MLASLSRLTDPAHLGFLLRTGVAAGALAGLVLGGFHFMATEPVIDRAIAFEEAAAAARGEAPDVLPYTRDQQKAGLVLGTTLLGIGAAMVFALLYSVFRDRFPRASALRSSLLLAAVALVVWFLVPFWKYPANPPGVGSTETITYRAGLHSLFLALSLLAALGAAALWRHLRSRAGPLRAAAAATAAYALGAGALFALMPPNPDPVTAPPDIVATFRTLSAAGLVLFWASLGLFFGLLWKRSERRRPAAG